MRFSTLTIAFAVAASVALAAFPGSAVAGSQVPFKGTLEGSTVKPVKPGFERIEVSGRATHLGAYTAVIEADLSRIRVIGYDPDAKLPIATLPFVAKFTAADGDQIDVEMTLVGLFDPVAQNFPSFTATATVTGGTGRFAGATGSFSASGGQTTVPGEDNDLIHGSFTGTLSSVGSG